MPAVELRRPRRRARTGDAGASVARPAIRNNPPATQAKTAASRMRPMSSPIDHLRKSKTFVIALEKTASALAKSSANTTRNGKASAIPMPTETIRPPVRRASGRPRSGSAASSSAPPATIRPTTTSPRMTSRSTARRVRGTPAKETAAIVTRTSVAGTSNSSSMRSTRRAGRNAKTSAAGAIHRSSRSIRAPGGRKRQATARTTTAAAPTLMPSGDR